MILGILDWPQQLQRVLFNSCTFFKLDVILYFGPYKIILNLLISTNMVVLYMLSIQSLPAASNWVTKFQYACCT